MHPRRNRFLQFKENSISKQNKPYKSLDTIYSQVKPVVAETSSLSSVDLSGDYVNILDETTRVKKAKASKTPLDKSSKARELFEHLNPNQRRLLLEERALHEFSASQSTDANYGGDGGFDGYNDKDAIAWFAAVEAQGGYITTNNKKAFTRAFYKLKNTQAYYGGRLWDKIRQGYWFLGQEETSPGVLTNAAFNGIAVPWGSNLINNTVATVLNGFEEPPSSIAYDKYQGITDTTAFINTNIDIASPGWGITRHGYVYLDGGTIGFDGTTPIHQMGGAFTSSTSPYAFDPPIYGGGFSFNFRPSGPYLYGIAQIGGPSPARFATLAANGNYLGTEIDISGYNVTGYTGNVTTSGLYARKGWGIINSNVGVYQYNPRITLPATTKNWTGIAMSSDGKYQTAASGQYIYRSEDYGVTWSQVTDVANNWLGVAMSSDGRYQTAVSNKSTGDGYIYRSIDYGVTWLPRTGDALLWQSIAMSSDGSIQAAVAASTSGGIFISTDYGDTWNRYASVAAWQGIAMSSDGRIMTVVSSSPNYIYRSTDYGSSWENVGNGVVSSPQIILGIDMSVDGKYQTIISGSGYIYRSTDYGSSGSWTQVTNDTTRNWRGIAMSSNGQLQVATADSGYIYRSTDYGSLGSWTQVTNDATRYWTLRGIAISSDGQLQAAVVAGGGYIYRSTDYGSLGSWSQVTKETPPQIDPPSFAFGSGRYFGAYSGANRMAPGTPPDSEYLFIGLDYGNNASPNTKVAATFGEGLHYTDFQALDDIVDTLKAELT